MYQRCDSRIYWAWAIISSRWHRRYVSVPRWLFQERRLSLTLRLTFAVQRSCELEHLATTSQPSFVCLLLSKAHKVSPARAPSVSMTVSKKPLRSSAEQALASVAHMPTKDMLTASSVNYSRVSLHYRPRARSVPMFGPECHLLEAQSDHPILQRCADRARLTLRVRVALGAALAQGETGLMLTSGRMRLAGMF